MTVYLAETKWTWEDVMTVYPEFTDVQAQEWLEANEKYLAEACIRAGYEAMEALGREIE